MESTKAHLQQMSTAFEDLADSLLDASTINTFADSMKKVLSLLTSFVDILGGGKNTLVLLGSVGARVFNQQLAQGLARVITNLNIARKNMQQLTAEEELLRDFQYSNINVPYLDVLLRMKETAMEFRSIMTPQQSQTANEFIRIQNDLQNTILTLQEAQREAQNFYRIATGSENQNPINFANLQHGSTEFNTYINDLRAVRQEYRNINTDIEVFRNSLRDVTTLFQANQTETEEYEEALNDVNRSIEIFLGRNEDYAAFSSRLFTDDMRAAVDRYNQALREATERGRDIASDRNLQLAARNLATNVAVFADDVRSRVTNTIRTIENEGNGATRNAENNIESARRAWNNFIEEIRLVRDMTIVIDLARGFGMLASSMMTISNIKNIIDDKEISNAEKFLKVVTALGFALPMLASSIRTIGSSLGRILRLIGGVEAAAALVSHNFIQFFAAVVKGISIIAPQIAIVTAIVILLAVALKKAYDQFTMYEKAVEKATERADQLAESYKNLKTAQDEFLSSVKEYNDIIDSLEELDKQTQEYTDTISKANDKAIELIQNNRDLQKAIERNSDGLLIFKENALEAYEEQKKLQVLNAQQNSLIAEQRKNDAIREKEMHDIRSDLKVKNTGVYYTDYSWQKLSDEQLNQLLEDLKDNGYLLSENIESLNLKSGRLEKALIESLNSGTLTDMLQSIIDLEDSNENLENVIRQAYLEEEISDYGDRTQAEINAIDAIIKRAEGQQDINPIQLAQEEYKTAKERRKAYIEYFPDYKLKGSSIYQGDEKLDIDDEQISTFLGDKLKYQFLLSSSDALKKVDLMKEISEDLEKQFKVSGLQDAMISLLTGDVDFSNLIISKEKLAQLTEYLQSNYKDIFKGMNFSDTGYENGKDFVNGFVQASLDSSLKTGEAAKKANQAAMAVMEGIQSRDIDYKNIEENEDYKNLISELNSLKRLYPELDAVAEILNQTWNVGTQTYIEALETAQDKLYELQQTEFGGAFEKAEEAASKLDEIIEGDYREGFNLSIEPNTEEFDTIMREILDTNYQIDIAIHAEAEQEFDSIMNAYDDIEEKVSKIGENYIIAADDMREFNNTFPGILQGWQQLADGTIQLNQQMVEAAVDGVKAEVDADREAFVEKLKLQVQDLRAKQQSYLQMADAAAKLANYEKLSEKEKSDAIGKMNSALTNLKETNKQIEERFSLDSDINIADSAKSASEASYQSWTAGMKKELDQKAKWTQAMIQNNQSAANPEGGPIQDGSIIDTDYQGATAQSREATIIQEAEEKLDEADNAAYEELAKMEELFRALAESAGDQANDLEGMIAQAEASGSELGHLLDRIRAGKGPKDSKEKTKDPDKMDALEDEFDIYHDINLIIEEISTNLSRIEKQQKKLYGKDLLNSLNEQLDVLEQQKAAYQAKIELAKQELEAIKQSLALQGVTFNDDGYISNYMEILQAKLDYVNSLIAQYNAMSAEEQEDFKEVVEQAKKDYEKFKDQIEKYDNLISQTIPDLEDQIQDAIDKQIEIQIQKFTMEVEIRLNMAEMERDFNEFKRKVLDGIKDDDILGNAKSKLKDFLSYFNTFDTDTGPIQKLTEQINETMDQIKQIDEEGWADVYGDNKAQAMEDLQKYYEELMSQLEDIVDLVDEIRESYLDMIDEAIDAFDKQVDQYEYINDLINHNINIIGLLYGDNAYSEMEKYYEQIEKNNNQELDFLRQRVDYAEEMMNAETDPKAKEKWQEEWMNALSELNKKVKDSVQNIIDKYVNAINKTFDELNKKVTGGLGLDYVSDEWDLINKNADQYLDTINAMYGIQKLENKYLDAINNTDSLSAQRKLNDLMEEQLSMLRDKEKLTQYDVDRANMLYEIALKEIALQEAQQNKSKIRLRRDSQGNYTYQYVSDEDAIAQAQDDLLAAQNDLYNFDKEKYRENLNEIYTIYNEFQEKLLQLYQDQTLTAEERQQKEAMLVEQYGQLINGLVEQNEDIKNNLRESAFLDLAAMYNTDVENFNNMSEEEQDILMNSLVPQWESGIQHMADVFSGNGGFIPTCSDAFKDLNDITKDYQNSLDDLERAAGIDFDSMARGYDENIDKARELLYANDDLIDKYRDEIDAIRAVIAELDDLIRQYQEAQAAAEAATAAAYAFIQAQQEAAAEAGKDSGGESGSGGSGGDSGSGGNTGGGGSGSGGSGGGSGSGGNGGGSGSGGSGGGSSDSKKHGYIIKSALDERVMESKEGFQDYSSAKVAGLYRIQRLKETGSAARMPYLASAYNTGGYTGEWGDQNGKLAFLHQKELVLNSQDTENILSAVGIVRDIADVLNNMQENMMSRVIGLSSKINTPISNISNESNTVEQSVHIEANFPGVNKAKEIEDAFNNLTNVASQRAFNTKI